MISTDNEFSRIVLTYYDNPSCVDIKEFQDDVKRFNLLNRYLSNIEDWQPKTYRRVINSVIILYNLFGEATNKLLRYKLVQDNIPRVISISAHINKLTNDLGLEEQQDKEFRERINELS